MIQTVCTMLKIALFLLLFTQLFCDSAEASTKFHRPDLAVLYDELLVALDKGENVIYVVPPPNVVGTAADVRNALWWEECNPANRLTDQGLADATALGKAIHQIGFRYFTVKISKECLTLNVASLMFRSPDTPFERTTDLNPAEFQRKQFGYRDEIIKLQMLGAILPAFYIGENSFVISHRQPKAVALHPVLSELDPGDTAIFSLSTSGDLVLRARLNIQQWLEMAKYSNNKRKQMNKK